jgi:hypothetical protein
MYYGLLIDGHVWDVIDWDNNIKPTLNDFNVDVGFHDDVVFMPVSVKFTTESADWWGLVHKGDLIKIKTFPSEPSVYDFQVANPDASQVVPLLVTPTIFKSPDERFVDTTFHEESRESDEEHG